MTSKRITTRELVLYALLGAVMFALKMAMAALPNIEPVSLLVILYTLTFGRWALWPIYVYVLLEILTWGVNFWTVNYLYVWAILFLLTCLFRKMSAPLGWAVVAGGFGLCFGLLCVPVYWVSGGWAFAVSWWISGIPYDILHCVGNFFMVLLLYKPGYRVLQLLKQQKIFAG